MEEKKDVALTEGQQDEELVTKENGDFSLLHVPEADLAIAVKRAEQNVELYNKIKMVSLKVTKPSDWVLQGGKVPYLMERGAQNIANMWGVNITTDEPKFHWIDDEKGKYYMYTVHGRAHARQLGRVIEDEGICTSRDKFFGRTSDGFKELSEVDMPNVRRKAMTNLYNRLIKRVTGLINVTMDDLTGAGFDVAKIGKILYGEGTKGGAPKVSNESMTMRDKLWAMCLEMAAGDFEEAKAILKLHSSFTKKQDDGTEKEFFVTEIKGLKSDGWIKATHGRVKEAYEASK